MINSPLIQKAITFARAAHAAIGQKRKYNGEPYTVHTERVAKTVFNITGNVRAAAAACLHDILEDTQVTFELLVQEFDLAVAQLVLEVTNQSRPEDGNRKVRKEIDKRHIEKASVLGKTIKLADIIDNCSDLKVQNPEYAVKYCAEKLDLLEVLKEGDQNLWNQAYELVK